MSVAVRVGWMTAVVAFAIRCSSRDAPGEDVIAGGDPDGSWGEETVSAAIEILDAERGVSDVLAPEGLDEAEPAHLLGLPLRDDGVLYAGAAAVDITPEVSQGKPVFMGGFGRNRVAEGVHDPLFVRSLVLARDREYLAIVAVDVVGLTSYRIGLAAQALAADGWDPDRLLVHAIHNHAGPDTLGMWGPSPDATGLDPAYQERLASAVVESVRQAAARALPATLKAGATRVSSVSPYFTSPEFGGKSPVSQTIGLIRDSRDPVVVDDTLTAIGLFADSGEAIATVAHLNTHVEVSGGHHLISADFARAARDLLEKRFGGVGLLWIGTEGGLQTPLDVPLPQTDADGRIEFETCDEEAVTDPADPDCFGAQTGAVRLDGDGDPIPAWAEGTWERTDTYGRLIGRLAADLLDEAEPFPDPPVGVTTASFLLPLENRAFEAMGMHVDTAFLDPYEEMVKTAFPEYADDFEVLKATLEAAVLDFPAEGYLVTGGECPSDVTGCLPERVWTVRIGPVVLRTVPGELFPEYVVGTPPGAESEFEDAGRRGPGSAFFPQYDPDCAAVPYKDCWLAVSVGACDCRFAHAAPYVLSGGSPPLQPLAAEGPGDFSIVLGLTGDMVGYIVPEPDSTRLLARPFEEMFSFPAILDVIEYASDSGDHYEEGVSIGPTAGTRILEALQAIP